MRFSATLWQGAEPIYQAIIEHPLVRELADGSLSRERFEFYIRQDALYLVDFGRALAIVGSRLTNPTRVLDFVRFAEGTVVFERALHEEYFQLFRIDSLTAVQSPVCFAYTNYLIATAAHRSCEEGVAALLPCFWIYQEVGTHIYERAAAHNPYQKWIDTYAGDEFGRMVAKAIEITDEVADQASPKGRVAMKDAFITSSRLEWMFWDSAYRMERWEPAFGRTVP